MRDDSLCSAGLWHVAYLIAQKCGVLESILSNSSVTAGKCVCALLALFGSI